MRPARPIPRPAAYRCRSTGLVGYPSLIRVSSESHARGGQVATLLGFAGSRLLMQGLVCGAYLAVVARALAQAHPVPPRARPAPPHLGAREREGTREASLSERRP